MSNFYPINEYKRQKELRILYWLSSRICVLIFTAFCYSNLIEIYIFLSFYLSLKLKYWNLTVKFRPHSLTSQILKLVFFTPRVLKALRYVSAVCDALGGMTAANEFLREEFKLDANAVETSTTWGDFYRPSTTSEFIATQKNDEKYFDFWTSAKKIRDYISYLQIKSLKFRIFLKVPNSNANNH